MRSPASRSRGRTSARKYGSSSRKLQNDTVVPAKPDFAHPHHLLGDVRAACRSADRCRRRRRSACDAADRPRDRARRNSSPWPPCRSRRSPCPPCARRSSRSNPPPPPGSAGTRRGRWCRRPTSRPDARRARLSYRRHARARLRSSTKVVKRIIRRPRREFAADRGERRVQRHRPRPLHRQRQARYVAQIVELAVVIERRAAGDRASRGPRPIRAPAHSGPRSSAGRTARTPPDSSRRRC